MINNENIVNYLSGNCNDKEIEELLQWVESSEENRRLFSEMKNAWAVSNIASKEITKTEEHFQNLKDKIQSSSSEVPIDKGIKIPIFWRMAASVIIAIGLTALVSYIIWNKKEDRVAYHQLIVPSGQQAQLLLSDGTKIWLNSKSRLTYPGTFGSKIREVVLDGEGYFQVSHNPEKPFIVKTSHLDVKVLGTSFNITNYNDENEITLALETGSISISEKGSKHETIKLKPNDLAIYSKLNRNIQLAQADSDVYKSWLKGQFKFRNLSFEEISRRLARNFNVQFIFEDEDVKQIKYNGSFYNYESLSQILKIMKTNSPFRYRIVKDKVFIE